MSEDRVYWLGDLGEADDFGQPYEDEMIDGKTVHGPWACMTPLSWKMFGGTEGRLGTGLGQRYKKQASGCWLKVEG